ncbi:uncharacterized protein Nmag_1991 [Natrialba magadii ATCC 43099]|uniref:Uncharacterized protein n=2 Tax=Natrialba TaxID=63742 RepID=D3SVF4_NATMM|nr:MULTISPECIES: hypothetical protein [Natrialba]ADD05562.1 uncharacterized protein Nmag_1991 [Natrialba magadii ATCC 43099]ELY30023.1 hypothetical protein C500_10444 [Natrialba magadii ATCC 43099]ELY90644.1 hypothetical protein C483_11306 [Natrialba hulunbeirensis JCM 10989]
MVSKPHTTAADETVVGSIDSTDSSDEYVIADISADDAWLSMRADEAMTLPAWR